MHQISVDSPYSCVWGSYLHFQYAIHCRRTVVNDNIANVRLSWICEGKGDWLVIAIGLNMSCLVHSLLISYHS